MYGNHCFQEGRQVLVIRHAERAEIPTGKWGHELTLTQQGKEAAEALGAILSRTEWGEVHSSPLMRCQQTAFHFLKGAQQNTPVILSSMLGDPGPFVSHPEKAGPVFLSNTLEHIKSQITSNHLLPGIQTLDEGGQLFTSYLKTIKHFPCLMISHDIIIALLATYFSKSETDLPRFLEGFCIDFSDDKSTSLRVIGPKIDCSFR